MAEVKKPDPPKPVPAKPAAAPVITGTGKATMSADAKAVILPPFEPHDEKPAAGRLEPEFIRPGPADTVSTTAIRDTPPRSDRNDARRKPHDEDDEDEGEGNKKLPMLQLAGPLPKGIPAAVVSEHSRAPAGYQRFRIRAMNYVGYSNLYILAGVGDLAAAKKCYLEASGLQKYVDDLGEIIDAREVKRPQLNVLALPD